MIRYALISALLCTQAYADSSSMNLALPSMGQSYGQDKVRAGDFECSASVSGGTTFETGVSSIINNAVSPFESDDPMNPQTKDIGLYARIVIPLDAPPKRLDCTQLYNLELSRKRLELQKLQQELDNLRKLQKQAFEN